MGKVYEAPETRSQVKYMQIIEDSLGWDGMQMCIRDRCYQCVKAMLESGAKFDYGHFWEDICFKNGPLVIPSVFEEYVGPHYKKITSLLNPVSYTHLFFSACSRKSTTFLRSL